jgi:murein L,D-transpeptidase YafK
MKDGRPLTVSLKLGRVVYFRLVTLCAIALSLLLIMTVSPENSGRAMDKSEAVPEPVSLEVLKLPLKDPRIVIYKSKRRLELHSDGRVVRTYAIGLGFSPVGDKQKEGDGRTPEGDFYIFVKNPKSAYYLSLGVSYPNIEDAERGLRDGLISNAQHAQILRAIRNKTAPPQYTSLGGLIYIHGNGAGSDWTWGCVALDNANMKELFDSVAVGTPVTIKP